MPGGLPHRRPDLAGQQNHARARTIGRKPIGEPGLAAVPAGRGRAVHRRIPARDDQRVHRVVARRGAAPSSARPRIRAAQPGAPGCRPCSASKISTRGTLTASLTAPDRPVPGAGGGSAPSCMTAATISPDRENALESAHDRCWRSATTGCTATTVGVRSHEIIIAWSSDATRSWSRISWR